MIYVNGVCIWIWMYGCMWCEYVHMCNMCVWYKYMYVFMGCVVWVCVWCEFVWSCDINVCESVYGVSVLCCECVMCLVGVCLWYECALSVCVWYESMCVCVNGMSEWVCECECLCTCVFEKVHVSCVYVWFVYTMHTHAQGRGIACLVYNSFLRESLRDGEDVQQLATCPCGWAL